MRATKVQKTINMISEQTGITLTATGKSTSKFFNVEIPARVSEWDKYDQLISFANRSGLIRIEPNGFCTLAIYPIKVK